MWLFTRYGFFSVVSARQGDGAHGRPVDPDRVMIRARRRADLVSLRKAYPALRGAQIRAFRGTDYPFRIFAPKYVWSCVAAALAQEIDYDNFKGECAASGQDRAYLHALHEVWHVMAGLEPRRGLPEPAAMAPRDLPGQRRFDAEGFPEEEPLPL